MSSTRSARAGVPSRERSASSCAVQRSQWGRKTSPSRASARSRRVSAAELEPDEQAREARCGAGSRTDALDDQELGRLERPRLAVAPVDPVVARHLHDAARGERLEHGADEQVDARLQAVPAGIELLELDDRCTRAPARARVRAWSCPRRLVRRSRSRGSRRRAERRLARAARSARGLLVAERVAHLPGSSAFVNRSRGAGSAPLTGRPWRGSSRAP